MDSTEKTLGGRPTHFRWIVFALSCGTSWLLYLHRYTFAYIKPALAEEFGLGKDQLGLLDSAFSVPYTLCQFPLGIAADVVGVHLVLTILILVGSGGLALHAWAPTTAVMWYARVTLGAGQSAILATISRIARFWFPVSVRTTLQGTAGVLAARFGGLCAGLLFSYFLLGLLQLDWRTAIYLLAAAGAVHAMLFGVLFRNAPRKHPLVNSAEADLIEGHRPVESPKEAGAPPRMTIRRLLPGLKPRALLNLVALNIQTILSTFADNIYSAWIPLFLREVHRLDYKQMGIYSALPLLGGAIAGLLGGILNDALIAITKNRRWSRSGIACFGKGAAGILLFAALVWYDSPYVFCAFLFFVKFFGDWSLTTTWGVVTDIGGRASASVFAFNNSVAGIGSILAPIVYGYVAEHFDWKPVFVLTAVTYVLCALSWLAIDCTIPMLDEQDGNE